MCRGFLTSLSRPDPQGFEPPLECQESVAKLDSGPPDSLQPKTIKFPWVDSPAFRCRTNLRSGGSI